MRGKLRKIQVWGFRYEGNSCGTFYYGFATVKSVSSYQQFLYQHHPALVTCYTIKNHGRAGE